MSREELKKIIKTAAIKSVTDYFDRKLQSQAKPNFQILDLLMPKERLVRSIVGGLETAMGKTLWEPLAKEIATANGFTVINSNLECPTNMPGAVSNTIQNILEARLANNGLYDATSSHAEIKRICQQYLANPIGSFRRAPTGFGVDIWLQKNNIDYFFDTKTVQPNVGSYTKFLSQILNWYAYYYTKNPVGTAVAKLVFPYNPYQEDFWTRTMGNGRPLEAGGEALVEDEFWDFISGVNGTFSLIKESFTEIYAEGTLDEKLDEIFDRAKVKIEEEVKDAAKNDVIS